MFLCIEKNFKNDALIFGTYTNCIYKYDLAQILRGEECEPIWIADQFFYPQGIVVCYSNKYENLFGSHLARGDRLLFVCDECTHSIKVLRSSDGKILESIGVKRNDSSQKTLDVVEFNGPSGIDLDEHDNLIISEYSGRRIQVIGKSEAGQLIVLKSLPLNTQPCRLRGVVYDHIARNIIVCDCEAHTISILNGGQVVSCFGSYEFSETNELRCPSGLCLN